MIDLAASHRHYLDHLLPVWRRLPDEIRGQAFVLTELMAMLPGSQPIDYIQPVGPATLVAGLDDLKRMGGRPAILMEHGAGQSYGADPLTAHHPAYAGGSGRHGVLGFLCPNEYAAARNREAQPDAYVAVVGSPRLAELQGIPGPPPVGPDQIPTVAVSFHFDLTLLAETASTWGHWAEAVRQLAESGEVELLGHAHPRMFRDLAPTYRAFGIEPVADFVEVLQRAHVYCVDNSSTLFEFAAVRGPVVVLDSPRYRRSMNHGLRFWDCADVGPRIIEPIALPLAIRQALAQQPWPGAEERLARVFPAVEDPAGVAAAAAVEAAERAVIKSRSPRRFPATAPPPS